MCRLLALAFLVAVAFPSRPILADDCVTPSAGATTPITLRATPSASSAARGTLGPGQSLPFVASVPNWYEVSLAGGQSAFASKRSTDITPCPAAATGGPPSTGTPGSTGASRSPGPAFEIHVIDVVTGLSVFV